MGKEPWERTENMTDMRRKDKELSVDGEEAKKGTVRQERKEENKVNRHKSERRDEQEKGKGAQKNTERDCGGEECESKSNTLRESPLIVVMAGLALLFG